MRPIALAVAREASGGRLDRFLAQSLPVSRSELQRWIAEGHVTVGGVVRAASAQVREGETVLVTPPPPPLTDARPEAGVVFDVLHVDEDIVVVDKPAGLVVHPARGHEGGTLVNGLLAMGLFDAFAGPEGLAGEAGEGAGDKHRPGIVHRLDKGTSGVMVVARTPEARESLSAQLKSHSVERAYEAVVVGQAVSRTFDTLHGRHPRDRMRFTTHVRTGKRAVTHVRVLASLHGATHVECRLETGRTHQIRVHLAESGTPVLGDPLYGKSPRDERVRAAGERLGHQALHARVLGFLHPRSGRAIRFEAPPPPDFEEVVIALQEP